MFQGSKWYITCLFPFSFNLCVLIIWSDLSLFENSQFPFLTVIAACFMSEVAVFKWVSTFAFYRYVTPIWPSEPPRATQHCRIFFCLCIYTLLWGFFCGFSVVWRLNLTSVTEKSVKVRVKRKMKTFSR